MKYIAKFEHLKKLVIGEIVDGTVQIDLTNPNGTTVLSGWINNLEEQYLTDSCNKTSDPQEEFDFQFYAPQVTDDSYAEACEWTDNILAMQGMAFDIQDFSVQINDALKEHFSEKHVESEKEYEKTYDPY